MVISLWVPFAMICAAGAVGGLVNGLLSSNGFLLPATQQVDGLRIIRPGFFGNILLGMVAAALSWGLYGPLSITPLFSSPTAVDNFTLSSLVGAILVGIAGARWITNEVDKKLLTLAASQAAAAPADAVAAQKIVAASPSETLAITQNLSQAHP